MKETEGRRKKLKKKKKKKIKCIPPQCGQKDFKRKRKNHEK